MEEVEVEVEVEEGMKADADADADATTIRGMATDETDVSAKAAAISTDAKEGLTADETNTEEMTEAVDGTNVDRDTTIVTTETSGANPEADLVKATADAPRFATGMDLAMGTAALAIGSTTHPVVNAAVNAHRTIARDSVVRVENLVDPLMIAAIPISIATTKVSVAGLTIPLDDVIPLVVRARAANGTTAGIPIGNRHPMTFACGETRIVVGTKTNIS